MAEKCEIRWGEPFGPADGNDAIGHVRLRRHVVQINGVGVPQGDNDHWYAICATHARMLDLPGMHHWEFRPIETEE